MLFDLQVLENYIENNQIPDEHAWFYQYTKGFCMCAKNRQDIVSALSTILTDSILQFPYFNKACIEQIFKEDLNRLHNVIVMPILASSTSFDSEVVYHEGTYYLLIDLLNIANYTIRLNEMQYILENQITIQLLRFLIHSRYEQKDGFVNTIEDSFFCDGLAQYLAWNEDCKKYPFHEASYEKKKNNASALLHKYYFSEDKQLQDKILNVLRDVSFWNTFPMIYGLFFFHRIYMDKQEKGLCDIYAQGPSLLPHILLHENINVS